MIGINKGQKSGKLGKTFLKGFSGPADLLSHEWSVRWQGISGLVN